MSRRGKREVRGGERESERERERGVEGVLPLRLFLLSFGFCSPRRLEGPAQRERVRERETEREAGQCSEAA